MDLLNHLKKLIPDNIFFFLKKRSIFKKKYFGLNNLDEKVSKYLNYNNGFFVELGANDGISQSNTLHFERYKEWKGILIEPIKHKYEQCLNIRSKDNKFYNFACVSNEFTENNIKILYSNLRSITLDEKNLISPNKHINHEDLNIYQKHEELTVKVRTLEAIFDNAKAPKLMDFLSLDTEGYEVEILKGNNFTKYNFRYILIETKNINIISSFLLKRKYILLEKFTNHDYLFKKE